MKYRVILAGTLLTVALGAAAAPGQVDAEADAPAARVARVLAATPLIDGHNDLPWQYFRRHPIY